MSQQYTVGDIKKTLLKQLTETNNKILMWMKTDIIKRVYRKLDGGYLGVRSGNLRRYTNVVLDKEKEKLYVGTSMIYGKGYETGKWAGIPRGKEMIPQKLKAKWSGNPKHRPFMRDSIVESQKALSRIIRRLARP